MAHELFDVPGLGPPTRHEREATTHGSRRWQSRVLRPRIPHGPGHRGPSPRDVGDRGETRSVERMIQQTKTGRLQQSRRGLERMGHAQVWTVVVTNGEPRSLDELIVEICRAGGAPVPRLNAPGWLARGAGSVIERMGLASGSRNLVHEEPPLTRFLPEQLSTAHWFDQRDTQRVLNWKPELSIDEGLARLALHYGKTGSAIWEANLALSD